ARQAEQARGRVAWLRPRRDRADLDEAEAQPEQRVDVGAVLVQARGQAHRVGEVETERAGGEGPRRGAEKGARAHAVRALELPEAGPVGALGLQAEQNRAQRAVLLRR